MRSGRGKCPQCKEIIVVDLDEREIRCPFCGALLKKSAKTPAQARAEEEAARAELLARENAALKEEVAPAPVEEAPAAVVPAEESAPAAADELGISEEELAAMDEAPALEEKAEDAPADEIGLSDEELAAMDEAPNEALISDEAQGEETPAENAAEEPLVFGSIGADPEDKTPEEKAEAEEEQGEPAAEKEADIASNKNIELSDDIDPALLDEDLAALDDAPAAFAEEASVPVTENATEEVSAEEASAPVTENKAEEVSAEEPHSESPAEDAASAEESPNADIPVEDATEDDFGISTVPAEERASVADAPAEEPEESLAGLKEEDLFQEPAAPSEAPAEEIPVEEKAEERYVPTEEDMAFAASLSEPERKNTTAAFIPAARTDAPEKEKAQKKEKKAKRAEKAPVSKGEKPMHGESVYKKPVAVIMMILSILAAAIYFLYYKTLTIGLISEDLMASVAENLPTFGGANFPMYVAIAFFGLIAVVSVLGLTGRCGKLGFLFVLLADLVYAATLLFGGAAPMFEVESVAKIIADYGEYISYAIYAFLAVAAILFAVSLASGKDDYGFSGGTAILPLIYLAVVVLGYVALMLLPKILDDFTVSADLLRYSILGVIGIALLLTFVGVHNNEASRSANGWLIFASILAIALVNAAPVIVGKIAEAKNVAMDLMEAVPYFLTPIIAIFGVIGFTAADLRN